MPSAPKPANELDAQLRAMLSTGVEANIDIMDDTKVDADLNAETTLESLLDAQRSGELHVLLRSCALTTLFLQGNKLIRIHTMMRGAFVNAGSTT